MSAEATAKEMDFKATPVGSNDHVTVEHRAAADVAESGAASYVAGPV